MKQVIKMLVWVGMLLLLARAYYLIIPQIVGNILSAEPRNPKLEISETSEIGWWPYQESLTIDSFTVEFVESKLNLKNSKSLIRYTVKGKLVSQDHLKPSIKNIHVSKRFIRKSDGELNSKLDAVIEITPVIQVINDRNYNGEVLDFEFTNELKLESFHWGNNWVRFQCVDKWKDLIMKQRKLTMLLQYYSQVDDYGVYKRCG